MRTIGSADEFWRLRVTKVDTTEELDFEWHEDILYREPVVHDADEVELWHVEAVSLEDPERIVRIETHTSREDADGFVERAHDDLLDMTRSQFEATYLSADPSPPGGSGPL